MTIDKRALREVAERATQGPWEMEQENIWFTDEDGYTKHLAYVEQGDDVDDKQDHYNTAYIAAANPATMLALLDELEHYKSREERVTKLVLDNSTSWDALYKKLEAAEKRIAEQREYYEGVIADGSKRIAELERSETQLINERDSAESSLNDAYKAVMGQAPEWSNWFSFENAIDEIELVCELWRNQTDDVIQFRQRIQELEARQIALPQRLSPEGYHIDEAYMVDDDEGEYLDRDAVIEAIRAAGIKVKES
ncbi:ead/Ea22-like family protein [Salmonella enterica subsp. enterica serovar Ealing]|nr:ead/Ea22-like family protein [Salmonella enterica]ECG1003905.1 ead/Ea22-like family protein [Salmonella enterica subsp. salamae]ECG8522450.1 ead/Ea22-like family protein [Salmonella enterica subsp. diarizonae]EEJ2089987.1 ead/Ea22-like family protein [Salmonella enterica subsp. enterica serovar Ealing]EAP4934500.1 ead/Ea22-like family protein [Salmonella enterica]